MSRVAFFAESLTDSLMGQLSWELILSLLEQNHEVSVFTSSEQNLDFIPAHPRLTLLQPFRHWKWLETVPVLPVLMSLKPDILHFAQPHGQILRGWINSMNLLGAVHELLGKPLVVTSLFDVTDQQGWRQNLAVLLKRSDVITVTNTAQKDIVASWLKTEKRIEVFPVSKWGLRLPVPTLEETPLAKPFSKWAYLPGPMSDHTSLTQVVDLLAEIANLDSEIGIVFGGSWGRTPVRERHRMMAQLNKLGIDHRVFWTGELTLRESIEWMRLSELVTLPTLAHGSLSLANHLRQALSLRKPIVISYLQRVTLDLPDKLGSYIEVAVNLTRSELRKALYKAQSPAVNENISIEREMLDQSGNFLSRLYVTGLEQKQNHT